MNRTKRARWSVEVTRVPKLLISLYSLCILSIPSEAQKTWEIDKEKEGIIVYTREEAGSDFKSFKGVTVINSSTDEILKVLRNADNYIQWYGYTKTSKLLKQSDDVQYNYVETIFPWPYSNRDMVYKMFIKKLDSGAIEISLLGLSDYIPVQDGVVRMEKAEGYILLEPVSDKTKITYVLHSEPGAHIPPWLANNGIAEMPFRTLMGLRAVLEK